MALSVKVPRKQKAPPKRVKFGLPGCPIDKGFAACKYYFQYDVDRKILSDISKKFIKEEFSKDEAKAILANPEYHFNVYTHLIAAIYWKVAGQEFDESNIGYIRRAKEYYGDLIESGKKKLASEKVTEDGTPAPVKLNPQELLAKKVWSTIMVDIDTLEDEWTEGKKTGIKLYEQFKAHDLKAMAVPIVKKRIDRWLSEYEDAYNKECPQAVEGYSHLARSELKRRIGVVKGMLADLDRIKATTKATRAPRVPKARAADKQVQRLQYLKECNENKLVSINPLQVPGKYRLYTFNVKTRMLTEYVSSSTSGFEVKGTSIKNIDVEQSKSVRLRKPELFLPIVLSKTVKQISNEWGKLTTKSSVPNGRINKDTILLRVMDK
jgi:hypothetical protein